MQTQPNFEIVKRAFYQHFVDHEVTDFAIITEKINILTGKLQMSLKSYYNRKHEFKTELNTWLDRLDIRSVGTLIDILNADNVSLPSWIKNKRFAIDYNSRAALDLISTN